MEKAAILLINIIIMLTALLAGWILAWLCKDELVPDRKWLIAFFYIVLAAFIAVFLFYSDNVALLSLSYMIIAIGVMISLGYKKKFVHSKS